MNKEPKWKELATPDVQPKIATFYLGKINHFDEWYTEFQNRKVRVIEEQNRLKKKQEEDEEAGEEAAAATISKKDI